MRPGAGWGIPGGEKTWKFNENRGILSNTEAVPPLVAGLGLIVPFHPQPFISFKFRSGRLSLAGAGSSNEAPFCSSIGASWGLGHPKWAADAIPASYPKSAAYRDFFVNPHRGPVYAARETILPFQIQGTGPP